MKRSKVLMVTALSMPWNDGWYYKGGLERNGHIVIPFKELRDRNAPERLFDIVKQEKPDIVLHTKDEFPPEIFESLKQYSTVIQWYPDPVIPSWLPPYVEASDIFFTMSEGLVDEFKKYNPNVFWLTQAFEPSFFKTDRITEKDKKIYASDVTFVGNLGSKVQYLDRRTYLGRLLHEGINFKWWGPRLPRKLSTISLVLGKLGRSYGGKFVWGEEHAKIAKLSKIYLGIDSQPHVRKSMSERLYIAVGCGAFYMCLHVDGIEEVLEPDREIVTFRDEYEMIDKIKFYLKHDSLREKIARAGQKRVMSEHIYEVRIRQMMNIVAKHL